MSDKVEVLENIVDFDDCWIGGVIHIIIGEVMSVAENALDCFKADC